MAASDQLARLSVRAKEAETRAAEAKAKAKADLEEDVFSARASAQAQAQKLRETADASERKISAWWSDVQNTWNDLIATVRDNIDDRKAELDHERADRRAENAEGDALFRSTSPIRPSRKPNAPYSTRCWRAWTPTNSRRNPAPPPNAPGGDASAAGRAA